MMKPWRPLALAAVVLVTIGVGVGAAQTVTVTNAPADSTLELVLNGATVGSTAVDPAGFGSIPFDLEKLTGKRETDVYMFVDVCADSRRVLIAERGQQPPAPATGCERTDMGLFLLRRVSSVVVNVGGAIPTVLLIQGRFDPKDPQPLRPWNAAPTGLVLSAGGGLMRFSNVRDLSCGNVADCSGGGFNGGYSLGVTHWLAPFLAADVTFVKPAEATVSGSGTGFRFTSALDVRVLTISGQLAAPLGPIRIYGKAGGTFHQGTFQTTQTNDEITQTIDNVTQTIPGGTQTFELVTEGWGWQFGGGMEAWIRRWFALYAEAGFLKLKGRPVDDADGELSERVMPFVIGGRVHIGRR